MLGITHAAAGWCAGLALAPVLGAHVLPQAVVLGAITAGSALLSHLDHPDARQSRLLYLLTAGLSAIVQGLSRGLYFVAHGRYDDFGGERHYVTHTLVFAGLVGSGVTWWVSAAGTWAVVAVLMLACVFLVDALGDWALPVAAGAVLVALVNGEEMAAMSPLLGVAVGAGCLVHCLGEGATGEGSPLLWPLPLGGQMWREIQAPALVRFPAGGVFELVFLMPALLLTGALLLPGAWPAVTGMFR